MKIWVCSMVSERSTWDAYGETKEQAEQALLEKWISDTSEFNNRRTLEELDSYYGLNTREVETGKAYRDRE